MYNIKILIRIRFVCKNYINLHGHRTWFLLLNMAMENFFMKKLPFYQYKSLTKCILVPSQYLQVIFKACI